MYGKIACMEELNLDIFIIDTILNDKMFKQI
jgi:hypothetical protein